MAAGKESNKCFKNKCATLHAGLHFSPFSLNVKIIHVWLPLKPRLPSNTQLRSMLCDRLQGAAPLSDEVTEATNFSYIQMSLLCLECIWGGWGWGGGVAAPVTLEGIFSRSSKKGPPTLLFPQSSSPPPLDLAPRFLFPWQHMKGSHFIKVITLYKKCSSPQTH